MKKLIAILFLSLTVSAIFVLPAGASTIAVHAWYVQTGHREMTLLLKDAKAVRVSHNAKHTCKKLEADSNPFSKLPKVPYTAPTLESEWVETLSAFNSAGVVCIPKYSDGQINHGKKLIAKLTKQMK